MRVAREVLKQIRRLWRLLWGNRVVWLEETYEINGKKCTREQAEKLDKWSKEMDEWAKKMPPMPDL